MTSHSPESNSLDKITAPGNSQPQLEPEQAPLRESYLQMGKWLEQSAGDFDATEFLAQMQRDVARKPTSMSNQSWRKTIGLLLALATAVLFACFVWLRPSKNPAVANVPVAQAGTAGEFSLPWSDPLDDQLAAAWQQVRDAGGTSEVVDLPLLLLQDQMRVMEAELSSGSL